MSSRTSGGAAEPSASLRCSRSRSEFGVAAAASACWALRSAVDCGAARSGAGGGDDEPLRLVCGVGDGRGELEDEVGRLTPTRGDAPREAAPLMRFRAAAAGAGR